MCDEYGPREMLKSVCTDFKPNFQTDPDMATARGTYTHTHTKCKKHQNKTIRNKNRGRKN